MRFVVLISLCVGVLVLVGCRPQVPVEVDKLVDHDSQLETVDDVGLSVDEGGVATSKEANVVVEDKVMDGANGDVSGVFSGHAGWKSDAAMRRRRLDVENQHDDVRGMGGHGFSFPRAAGSACGVGRLSASATGSVEAEPDLAVLWVSVLVEDDSVAPARERVAGIIESAATAFRAHGVDDGDLTTSGFTVRIFYDYTDVGRTIRGYQVSHSLTAKFRDMDRIGALIDAVSVAGGDSLFFEGVRFEHDDAGALSDEARGLAVAELMRRAEMMSESAGRELGPLLSLDDGYSSSYSFKSDLYGMSMMDSMARSDTKLLVGTGTVEASVSGEFALMPVQDSEYCGRMSPHK